MKIKYLVIILALLITIGAVLFLGYQYHSYYRMYDPPVISKQQEIALYYNSFKVYEGQKVRRNLAIECINRVIINNMTCDNKIKIEYICASGDIIETASEILLLKDMCNKIETKYIFNIEITGYTSEGMVNKIRIEEVKIGT